MDESIGAEGKSRLLGALPAMREFLCRELEVDPSLAQLAIVPAFGLSDQALLAVEIQILPKPQRTRKHLHSTCETLRDTLRALVGTSCSAAPAPSFSKAEVAAAASIDQPRWRKGWSPGCCMPASGLIRTEESV